MVHHRPEPPDDLEDRITHLLNEQQLLREKKGKPYDLRPLIENLRQLPAAEPGTARLEMQLAARVGATGRADEVLHALGISPAACQIERTGLILNEMKQNR